MDTFDKKREMIQMLIGMLKKSAADEVSGHPHVADLSQTNEIQQKTSDSSAMAEGGLVGTDMHVDDQASRLTEPVAPMPGAQNEAAVSALPSEIVNDESQKDSRQSKHNENNMDEDEENNSSSFQAFLPRRKK